VRIAEDKRVLNPRPVGRGDSWRVAWDKGDPAGATSEDLQDCQEAPSSPFCPE
jgi:hypothetical protein